MTVREFVKLVNRIPKQNYDEQMKIDRRLYDEKDGFTYHRNLFIESDFYEESDGITIKCSNFKNGCYK